MKKVVELESRWKAYKYKRAIFYVFIALLVAFVALLTFFIKMQVFDKPQSKVAYNPQIIAESSLDSAPKYTQNSALDSANKADSAKIAESSLDSVPKEQISQQNKITFICRQVTTNKLTVRKEASFKSLALGYYPQDAIFCVSEAKNGLVKTQNGWVSASDKFSKIVDVNMFVDAGFYKYQNIAQPTARPAPKTNVEEVKVFDKPINSAKYSAESNIKPLAESRIDMPQPKKKVVITSGTITKEQIIEFKKADFHNRKDYATAIEVARYYYDVKDYENSIRWALNASSSNSKGKQKTESWIIYAKSLYLSGKQEQAIAVLDRYISSTNSKDAIDVLNKMKQGII